MMKKKITKYSVLTIALATILTSALIPDLKGRVYAQDTTVGIEGNLYELDEKSKYAYPGTTAVEISNTGSQFGTFSITGDITSISPVNGFTSYQVDAGVIQFAYKTDGKVINAAETSWHVIEDKSNEVNGEKLDGKILNGALILQSSNNGVTWITDVVNTNIAGSGSSYTSDFYETKEIQQINGCYYRLIVAYEIERRLADTQGVFGIVEKNYEKKKCVEVYEFYLKDETDAIIAAGAHPNTKKVVGDGTSVTNTGKDNGFSGINALTNKDQHYGWKIGDFVLKGYTNTADYQGEEYFLKNLGDAITLEFKLEHNINRLHGNDKLVIAEDKNGSDQYFQVPQTNFKHGTLIIRHTDFQGQKTDPIIYTDYLAAYARTNAETKVQFFEEGDYEVALDYEIKNNEGFGSVNNYRLFFTFKIRNGKAEKENAD